MGSYKDAPSKALPKVAPDPWPFFICQTKVYLGGSEPGKSFPALAKPGQFAILPEPDRQVLLLTSASRHRRAAAQPRFTPARLCQFHTFPVLFLCWFCIMREL